MKSNILLIALISVLVFATLHTSRTNTQQFQELKEENVILYEMLDSVLHTSHNNTQLLQELKEENATLRSKIDSKLRQQSQPRATTPAPAPKSKTIASAEFNNSANPGTGKAPAKKKIVVTSKYRIDNRYVQSKVYEPEYKGNQVGEIVINILVNYSGDVKSAEIGSITGITDEDVIEACKKAALRTDFNYDSDQAYGTKIPGTITYTFSSK